MSFKKYYSEGVYGLGDNTKLIGTTTVGGLHENHTHSYQVDDDGNGETSEDYGHMHYIEHFRVVSEHQHLHELEKEYL